MKKCFEFNILISIIVLLSTLTIPAYAQRDLSLINATISITTVNGEKDIISDTYFNQSRMHRNCGINYFEIALGGLPKKILWVHFSQVQSATFENTKNGLELSVMLDSGETLSGLFGDPEMTISGKGELGETTIEIKKVKSLEFIKFKEYLEDIVLNRKSASAKWKSLIKGSSMWKISDTNNTMNTEGFDIRDSYNDRTIRMYGTGGNTVREGNPGKRFKVQKGDQDYEIILDEFKWIEVTGRELNGKPEAILEKADGNRINVVLNLQGSTTFEEDDVLMWYKPFGYEGVSLSPLRRIVIQKIR